MRTLMLVSLERLNIPGSPKVTHGTTIESKRLTTSTIQLLKAKKVNVM